MTAKETVVVSARVSPSVQRALDERADTIGIKRQELIARGIHLVLEEAIVDQEENVQSSLDTLEEWGLGAP